MKSLKYIFALAFSAIVMVGCVKDETLPMPNDGVTRVQFRLGYSVPDAEVAVSRADLGAAAENSVNNLYLLIFDGNGNRVNPTNGALLTTNSGLSQTDNSLVAGTVTSEIVVEGAGDASAFKLYAVANIAADGGSSTYGVNQSMLDGITSLDGLQNATASLYENSLSRPNIILKVGMLEGATTTQGTDGVVVRSGQIVLHRIDAKITFNVKNGKYNGLDVIFKPESYQLMNMPMQSYLIERSTSAAAANGTDYSAVSTETTNSNPLQFEFNATSNAYDTFTFYMLESNLAPKQAPTAFNDRDQKLKKADGTYAGTDGNWVWEYANDAAPYVQIKGSVDIQGQNEIIRADVVYNVHLGFFNTTQNVNDFFTQRNTHYTYNLTIEGVEQIRLEVTKKDNLKDDPQSGAEGNVVVASNIRNVDCHYTQIMLTLKKPDAGNADKLSWYVDTPYSTGQYTEDKNKEDFDYKWVEFYVHGSATTTMATYQTAKGNTHYVDDIVDEMKKWVTGNSTLFDSYSNTAYVTAFINEFYYEYPFQYGNIEVQKGEAQGKYDKSGLITMIKKCVNGDSRYMHILSDIAYSPDGDSSETNSQVSIIQRPIRTVYNVDKMDETNYLIWGTESVNETYYLMPGRIPWNIGADSKNNGLRNTNALWLGDNRPVDDSNWSKYIDYSAGSDRTNEPNVKSQVVGSGRNTYNQHSIYACMSRNQDTNGNGTIDKSEIKWYMAAINQLSDLYIGESGLDPEAKLYPDVLKDLVQEASAKHKKQYYHYLSSYQGNEDDNGVILWAEEGSSTSHNSTGWTTGDDPGGGDGYRRLVRCLRNLGEDINTGNDVTPLMTYNSDTRIFDISMMNTASFRSSYYGSDAIITTGDQNDPYNKPRASFQIAERKNTSSGLRHCPDGFREPSMRELAIIFNLMGTSIESDAPYGCVTRCSNKDRGQYYYRIAKSYGGYCIELRPTDTNVTFRCVKDLE